MVFETELGVRFRDIDAMDHVNNAVYATYLEQARVDYFDEVVGDNLADVGSVLATLSIDYELPIGLDQGPVTVTVDVPELGRSSIPMEYEVYRTDGERAATGETVQVAYDREAASSKPIPEAWRERITDFHDF